MKKRKKGLIFVKDKDKLFINFNFEFLVFLALFSFTLVILFAPDYQSKQLFGEIVDTLFKGFLGYVTRIAYERYNSANSTINDYEESLNNYQYYSDYEENINNYENYHNLGEISYNKYDELLSKKQKLENELNEINKELFP